MRIPHRPLPKILALTVLAGLLLSFVTPLQRTVSSQAPAHSERKGTPKPGKPEGQLQSLDEIKNQANVAREPSLPVPSTMRSPKMPLSPWNGRRVGDPLSGEVTPAEPSGGPSATNSASNRAQERLARRAHARRTTSPAPYVVTDDSFIDNFYTRVMTASYTPLTAEKPYWRDQLRLGYAKNQTALKLAAIELGKTLFESAHYLGRTRNDSQYVEDLYWAYLMRAPDTSGWTFWTTEVSNSGRESVRRAFEESGEFLTLLSTMVPMVQLPVRRHR